MKHYFLIRCSAWEWCVLPLLHWATLNQHLCKCADVYHTETDWRSDASERIHKPVEEIKTLWTALLTGVVQFCWHEISCLTFGSITGFIVVQTLLEGCNNLKRIKWFVFWPNEVIATNLHQQIWMLLWKSKKTTARLENSFKLSIKRSYRTVSSSDLGVEAFVLI